MFLSIFLHGPSPSQRFQLGPSGGFAQGTSFPGQLRRGRCTKCPTEAMATCHLGPCHIPLGLHRDFMGFNGIQLAN